jgi:phage-related minor tail protein
MSDRGTADVTIRFGVQDAEVVRKALEALGKDGQAALDKINAASQQPSRGLSAFSSLMGSLKDRVSGLAFSIGPVGTALVQMGPAGLVAAAALGAVYSAFEKVSDGAKAFGAYSRQLKESSDITGIAITQFQALADLAQRHGVEAEKAAAGVNKFAGEHYNAARGAGELFDALKRIDPKLAEQFAAARSTGQALDVLATAYGRVDQATQAFLTRAAFGRGAASMGPALLELAGKGGLGAVTDAAVKAGAAIDEGLIKRQAAAAIEAERKAKLVENNWNAAYTAIYEKWKDFKKNVLGLDPNNELKISIVVRKAAEGLLDDNRRSLTDLLQERETVRKARLAEEEKLAAMQPPPVPEGLDQRALQMARRAAGLSAASARGQDVQQLRDNITEQRRREDELTASIERRGEAQREVSKGRFPETNEEEQRRKTVADTLTREIELDKEHLALLGQLATPEQQRALQAKELNLALLQRKPISEDEAKRIRESQNLQRDEAVVSKRTSLAIASDQEMLKVKLADLQQQRAKGFIKSDEEMAAAERVVRKEVEQTGEQMKVRASLTPALTQLGNESGNLKKMLDTDLASSFRSIPSDLLQIEKGAISAGEGFKNMGLKILDAIQSAILMKTIVNPLATSASSLLNGLLPGLGGATTKSALGNVFDNHRVMAFAGGGVLTRPILFPMADGMGLAGEAGPEAIMPLRRGPDGRLGVASQGGGATVVNKIEVHNHAAGVNVTQRERSDGGMDLVIRHAEDALAARMQRGQGSLSKTVGSQQQNRLWRG